MDNLKPKVTAVIVTYNRPDFVKESIQSVLNQTFTDFELIVVDNGVKIPAKDIVENFNDSRIRYIQNDKNTDCAGGKNIGMKNARGEFVAFLDDDDTWFPEKLRLQIDAFEKNQEAGFCFTAVTQVYEHGAIDSIVPSGMDNYYERALAKFSGFLAVTLMVKKKVFEDIGYMDELFPSHTDIEWIIRIANKYKGIGINKPLVRVMSLDHQQMGKNLDRRIKGREMILNKFKKEFEERPKVLAKHLLMLGKYYRNDGQYKKAKEIFKKVYQMEFKVSVFAHYLSMFLSGFGYKLFRILKLKKYPKTKNI
ncbi:MAG: glycosyltransferase family A protein [Patescibacteria group bacterium]|nr:glycosyltransferase family A protein [Patescibacteria group bacterium]